MDVTCERCGTEYDFDDALVSERGTTVKCTNCGAQFRVFRPVPAAGPERWVVRTVDGRELVFSALRELQAAISTGVVGRDDVLSRGGGRPRRLGSIAELEPFFKQAIVVAATSTAPGLGLPTPRVARQEGSAAVPLPRDPEGTTKKTGTLRPPPPVLHVPHADRSEVRPLAHDPIIHTAVTGSMQPTSVAAAPGARLQNLVAADLAEPVTVPRNDPRASPSPLMEPRVAKERTPAVPIGPSPTVGAPPVVVAPVHGDATIQDDGPSFAEPVNALSDTVKHVEGSAAREALRPEEAPGAARARRPEESGVVEKRSGGLDVAMPEPAPALAPAQRSRPPVVSVSLPPITPTPGDSRGSYIPEGEPSVSPRFSMAMGPKRNSSVRWIVGVVLIGATALLAATVGRKYLTAPAPAQSAAPVADDRVARLLDEGEKNLHDGDLEGAKEKFDKASALAENDPQVASHLAHLYVVKADQRWLKARILPAGPELSVAQAELIDAVEKMKKSVEGARSLLPNDAAVRRYRVDALRIAGDRAGARALVAEMPAAGKTPEDELTLAALDLAEEKPSWPTVIERLRSAAASDGNLGRARAMLVYALATSGDVAAAKAEHDRLRVQVPPHPLTVPLLAYMANVEIQGGGGAKPAGPSGSARPTGAAPSGSAASGSSAVAAGNPGAAGSPQPPGPKLPGGRVSDDYVAPNAGAVDISDMNGRAPQPPAPQPTQAPQPAPQPTQAPAPQPAKPPAGVDTSDLPGFGK
jgi:predicted Zn finger-like uncharacterized protein